MANMNENFYLGRQPILDRGQEIIGYELLFRSAGRDFAEFDSYSQAIATVITSALSSFGIQEVLGGKLGFINVNLDLLFSETLELLPIGQTVIELLEIIQLDDHVIERCRELKELGFQLALDDHEYSPDYNAAYAVIDIVKIDLLTVDPDHLPGIIEQLRRWPVRILAEKVETAEQFDACYSMGFDLFQGYFFERPVVLKKNKIDTSALAMLKLLQQLIMDATIDELEQTIKANPGISYNLLRLVNSVALGSREKIKTLRHAITMLGTSQMRRWIQLSFFAGNDARGVNNPLLEMAAVRGRLMEILVVQKELDRALGEQSEEAFMIGILSLLDVLFETPISEIIDSLNLTDEVSNALLYHEGMLGRLLCLAKRLEVTDFDTVTLLLDECDISLDQLLSAQLDAFNWRANVMSD